MITRVTRNRSKVRPLKLACQQRDVNPCGAAYDATAQQQTSSVTKIAGETFAAHF
jgi:hypothetical protein